LLRTAMIAAGGGAVSACVAMLALSGYPGGAILAYLAPLPLLLVGLGLGAAALPLAAAAGIGLVAATSGIAAAAVYGGLHALPSWLIVRIALAKKPEGPAGSVEWFPPGAVLCWLSALAAIMVLVGALGVWGEVESSVREVLDSALAVAAPAVNENDRAVLIAQIAPLFLGGTGVVWVTMMAINGVLAQGLLTRRGWNLRPSPQWSALKLPDWISWALVGAALVGIAGDGDLRYLGRNLVLVLLVPYFFVGLAVVHGFVRTMPIPGLLLTGFYVILGLAFPGMGAAVAALGVIEEWVGVRRALPFAPPGQGNE
jgi:Predicted membrane protein (DUF2232)